MVTVVDAHDQSVNHRYTVHYPAHPARSSDPHYRDFKEYRRRTVKTARCQFGLDRGNDFTECNGSLELHHAHIEFALQNGVDLALLEAKYPGVSDPVSIGAWIESAENLVYLCEFHHRGHAGVHVVSVSDYEASHYVRHLFS